LKNYRTIEQEQLDLKEQLTYLKNEKGINYAYWVKRLKINKGTIGGFVSGYRNLPKEIEDKLRKLIEEYKEELL
jgi:hypothetical protein